MKETIFMLVIALPVLCQPAPDAGKQDNQQQQKQNQTEPIERTTLDEERPVGKYNQPDWSVWRRFPTTRVYLQTPPEEFKFEQWVIIRDEKHDTPTETRFRSEFEAGLDYHLQFDIYFDTVHLGPDNDANPATNTIRDTSLEVRYAFADWDKIWGNPTIYFEYLFKTIPVIEPKLLLGGELSKGIHWGLNLIYEGEINIDRSDRDVEYSATAAVSRTITDQKFSAGIEARYTRETERVAGVPSETANSLYVGPSFQYRFSRRAAIDLAPLWGVTHDSRKMDIWFVFEWEIN